MTEETKPKGGWIYDMHFTDEENNRMAKIADEHNIPVKTLIRGAVQDYLENVDPDLHGWKIPESYFVTLVVPERVRARVALWKRLKHDVVVDANSRGLILLDNTSLLDIRGENRFVLLKTSSESTSKTSKKDKPKEGTQA